MNKFNLLKYLSKWKYLIFAVCVLGALIVYKYAMYNQEYTASTVISYTGHILYINIFPIYSIKFNPSIESTPHKDFLLIAASFRT